MTTSAASLPRITPGSEEFTTSVRTSRPSLIRSSLNVKLKQEISDLMVLENVEFLPNIISVMNFCEVP